LVAKFKYNENDSYTSPRRNLRTTGRWHKKSGRTEKVVINLKIQNPSLPGMSVKHLCTARPAGREIDRSQYAQAVEENNKRSGNPQLYRTRQETKRTFGTIKDNGVIITQFNVNGGTQSCWYTTSNAQSIYWRSDLIAKLKNELPYKAKACFVCITNYFFF
jgi:hypothetical protein